MLDASVILKWVLPESGQTAAVRYRSRHDEGSDVVVVPSLLWYEVANGIRKRQGLDETARATALGQIWAKGLQVRHVALAHLLAAVDLARSRGISAYDAMYVVLARQERCEFVTADRRLWERLQGESDVVLLGQE